MLHPGVNLSTCGPFREVVDDQIVDLVLDDRDVTLVELSGAPSKLTTTMDVLMTNPTHGPVDS